MRRIIASYLALIQVGFVAVLTVGLGAGLCSSAAYPQAAPAGASATAVAPGTAAPAVPPAAAAAAPNKAVLLKEARELLRSYNLTAAAAKYQAVLQMDSHNTVAQVGLARVHLKQGKVTEAVEQAAAALAENPYSSAAQTMQAEVLFRQGRVPEAEVLFAKVVNSGMFEPRAYLGMARVSEALSLYQRAKRMIDKAHEQDPGDRDIDGFWSETLPRAERIQVLERELAPVPDAAAVPASRASDQPAVAGPEAADLAKQRASRVRYLNFLQERERNPDKRCRLVNQLTATETELLPRQVDPTHITGYQLGVKVNGTKTKLLLDTGSGGILIDRAIAERAGIHKALDTRVYGIGDDANAFHETYVGYADSLRIGEMEFKDCLVEVWDKRSVLGSDGLIGTDIFQNYLVSIDFPGTKLKLTELPPRPHEEAAPAALVTGEESPYTETNPTKDTGAGRRR